MEIIIYGLAIIIIAYLLYQVAKSTPPPIPGLKNKRLLYVDNGKKRAFRSKKYRIKAKPDYVYRIDRETDAVVEYKHRDGKIYRSDEVQLIASVIAAREKYRNIKIGYIYTRDGTYRTYRLDVPTSELIARIEQELHAARNAANGIETPANRAPNKCRRCGVRYACNKAAA